MNVHVNENCIGCGLCVSMCGSVFLMTEEGVAAARDEIFPEQEGLAQEAAESCPVNAIEIIHH
ncbi:MAG: ferredoxin [Oscillospiraceae bacterium]|nr:ferredoxin [Oscillospiraceae bacterium]